MSLKDLPNIYMWILSVLRIQSGISIRYAAEVLIGYEVLVQRNEEFIPQIVKNVSSLIELGNYYSKSHLVVKHAFENQNKQ